MAKFVWLNYSKNDQRKMLDVVNAFEAGCSTTVRVETVDNFHGREAHVYRIPMTTPPADRILHSVDLPGYRTEVHE